MTPLLKSFSALSDGTRMAIVEQLMEHGESPAGDLVRGSGITAPAVSRHLKVLREAELVSVREEGQHRYYSLAVAPLDEVDDWLVPFFSVDVENEPALPESAVHAAEVVGRAAASVKHSVASAFRKLPGR